MTHMAMSLHPRNAYSPLVTAYTNTFFALGITPTCFRFSSCHFVDFMYVWMYLSTSSVSFNFKTRLKIKQSFKSPDQGQSKIFTQWIHNNKSSESVGNKQMNK